MNIDLQYRINKMIDATKATYLASKSLYKGKFIELVEEDYLLPNQVVMKRERIIKNHHKDAVIIVARTMTDKYLLVCQNRIDNMTTLELPSGFIENDETIFEAAKRELLEETGYACENTKLLDSYYTQLGIDASKVYVVLADGCLKVNSQDLGKYEYINYDLFSIDEIRELIANQYILSCGNKLAFYNLYDELLVRKKTHK